MPHSGRVQNASAMLRGWITKLAPLLVDHEDNSAYAMVSKTPCRRRRIVPNGLMCGSTVRKIHSVAIRNSSEITELSGSNGVLTFRRSLSLLGP